jgi:hypothetical protein
MNGKQEIMNFWYEFDNTFHFQIQPTVRQYYQQIFHRAEPTEDPMDHLNARWLYHRRNQSYPDGFKNEIETLSHAIIGLAKMQLTLIDTSFNKNPQLEQKAFEDFGQGVLYDERRALKLHKMDGNPPNPLIGYFRWHTFIQSAVLLGENFERWLQIDRYVGLAWAIQSIAPINEQDPKNQGLDPDTLNELREEWLSMQSQQLDDAFEEEFGELFS